MIQNKTAHQFARELLALPDLPILHFDPSFVDSCDEERDTTLGTPTAEIEDPCAGLTPEQVEDAKANGFTMEKFITINGNQDPELDRVLREKELPEPGA